MDNNALFSLAAVALLLLSFGCANAPPAQGCPSDTKVCPDGSTVGRIAPDCGFAPCPGLGSDRDIHGCIGSAGYVWCAETSQCIRPWETSCEPEMMPGSDRDEHGCIPSDGYLWCEAKSKCYRPWEENCTSIAATDVRIVTENFPPFNFEDVNGRVRGKSTAVVRGILAGMGQAGKIEVKEWTEGYELALGSAPNVALYSAARTLARNPYFKWVGPIGYFEEALYVRANSSLSIPNLEAAKGVGSVCVVTNDVRQQMLVERGFGNLRLRATDKDCVKDLAEGKVDLWFGSPDAAPMVAYWAGVGEDRIRNAYTVEKTELFIAFSNSTPDSTVLSWQAALDDMKASGLYGAIMGEYKEVAPDSSASMLSRIGPDKLAALESFADGKLLSIEADLKAAANTDSVSSGKWERIAPTLAPYAAKHNYTLFWYALPNGTYYTLPAGLAGGNLLDRSYFAEALSTKKPSLGTLVESKSTGKKAVVVAVPVMMGDVAGVLGGSTYLDQFSEEAAGKLSLPGYMYFFALDGDGQIALHSNPERIMEYPATFGGLSTTQAMETLVQTSQGEVDYEYGGRLRRAGYASSDSLPGWRYAIAQYLD